MFLQGFCISSVNYVNHPLPVFVHWSVPLIVRDLADLKGQLQMGAHSSFLPALLTLLLLLSHPPRAFLCSPGNLCHSNWPLLPRALGKSSLTALSTFFSFASGAPHSCSSPPPLSTPCTSSLEILLRGSKPQGTLANLERESRPTPLLAEKRRGKR